MQTLGGNKRGVAVGPVPGYEHRSRRGRSGGAARVGPEVWQLARIVADQLHPDNILPILMSGSPESLQVQDQLREGRHVGRVAAVHLQGRAPTSSPRRRH